ncbi:MAG: DUF362 domain-containing protein [Promethearchaeota archaeon]
MTISSTKPTYTTRFIHNILNRGKLKKKLLIFSLVHLLWIFFRTGTKPSRITYPCQQAAIDNLSISLSALFPLSIISTIFVTVKTWFFKNKTIVIATLLIGAISGGWSLSTQDSSSSQEFQLNLESKSATIFPTSDIYVVNGRAAAHIAELIDLMGLNGLYFYRSSREGNNCGSTGLIAQNDVILLKINEQWPARGGTNTDVLKEVIQAIIDHPDGFIGEIIVADNGQGRGSMDWYYANAEDDTQSTQDVVDFFTSYNVSTYDWQNIRSKSVDEYSEGDVADGYCVYETPDPETGIYVSYPKFTTEFGTNISFKHGIWNGTGYEMRLKVINMPILKSHVIYGVTASVKNYMGVQSEGLANGHDSVGTGGMGTLMVECGLPTLNIIDSVWINANPYPSSFTGPSTRYRDASRVNILLAGLDPIALDYWAAAHILIETAKLKGYEDTQSINPDNIDRDGLDEAFGVWLNLSKNEIQRAGFNVTTNEEQMNVFVFENHTHCLSSSMGSSTSLISQMSSDTASSNLSSVITSQRLSDSSTTDFGFISFFLCLSTIVIVFIKREKGK